MKTARRKSRSHNGITLIEMLGYIALLTLVSNLTYVVFFNFTKLNKQQNRQLTHLIKIEELSNILRKDVHSAVEISDKYEDFTSNKNTIIFKLLAIDDNKNPIENKYDRIIYTQQEDKPSSLVRKIIADEKSARNSYERVLAENIISVEFKHNKKLIELKIEFKKGTIYKDKITPYLITAAMRNNEM